MERAVADRGRRRRHHRNRVRTRTASGRPGCRAHRGVGAGDVAAAGAAGAAHHHRHPYHDVDRPRAAVLRARRDEAAAAAAVSVSDVCSGRLRRADERAGRGVSAGRRLLYLSRVAKAARRFAAHDAADRRAHQSRHRRPVVLPALSGARLGIHRLVHLRRKSWPLCRRHRRAIARHALLHPGDARRLVSLVVHDSSRTGLGDSFRAAEPRCAPARGVDRRHRRVLLALGHEGRLVHPPDRDGRSRADWRHAREGDRRGSRCCGPRHGQQAPRRCCCS